MTVSDFWPSDDAKNYTLVDCLQHSGHGKRRGVIILKGNLTGNIYWYYDSVHLPRRLFQLLRPRDLEQLSVGIEPTRSFRQALKDTGAPDRFWWIVLETTRSALGLDIDFTQQNTELIREMLI